MNKAKLVRTLAIVLFLAVLFSSAASGIGVSPGKTTVDYDAGSYRDISINVLNKEHKDIKALVYARGPLKDYIEIPQDIIELSRSENSKEVKVRLDFPEGLEPGTHETDIVFLTLPDAGGDDTIFVVDSGLTIFQSKSEGTVVAATVAVVSRISLRVPYPGKFAKVRMNVEASTPNVSTNFIVSVLNLGSEPIQKASATVDILGPTNEVIATLRSDEMPVKQKEAKEIILSWKADVNPGLYAAKATVYYDDKVSAVSETFSIGNIFVDITDIIVDPFRLGGIARFRLELESKWNKEISNLIAELEVYDKDQQRIATAKSSPINIDPLGRGTLDIFWDTESIPEGDYTGKIILRYSGTSSERNFKFYAGLEGIVADFMTTGRTVGPEAPLGRGQQLLFLGVIILALVNVGWWIYFLKIRGRNK